jgi:hypothetical protein
MQIFFTTLVTRGICQENSKIMANPQRGSLQEQEETKTKSKLSILDSEIPVLS